MTMSENPSTTDDSSTETEHTTDVNAAVIDAIQHLEGHADPGDGWDDSPEFQMKAAHDRLAHLDTSDAPRDVAETIRDAVDLLAETPNVPADECGVIAQTALAQLAPIAARVASGRQPDDGGARPTDAKPTVPLFYHIPQTAADRAIDRFKHRRARDPAPNRTARLAEFVYDEIEEEHVIWVEDEPLGDYAGSRVESMKIEASDDADADHVIRLPDPDRDHEPIPESPDELPELTDPLPEQRKAARLSYGADRVPDEGPIPSPRPHYHVPVNIEVPEWILDAVGNRLETYDNPTKTNVVDALMDFVMADEQFRTPDGRDAVAVLLVEHDHDDTDV